MQHQPFSQLIAELQELCREKVTGTLFITTDTNRSGQLVIDNGEIVFIYYSAKRGGIALDLMSEIDSCRGRFQKTRVTRKQSELPSTQEILLRLSGNGDQNQPGVESSPAPSQREPDEIEWDREVLDQSQELEMDATFGDIRFL